MAFFKFADLMLRGEPIPVYRRGELTRDFTYIDDAVEGALRALDAPPAADDASGGAPCRVYNLGNGREVRLRDYIRALEDALGVKASWKMLPMQPGDVAATRADMRAFRGAFGFTPETSVEEGLAKFAEWYRAHRSRSEKRAAGKIRSAARASRCSGSAMSACARAAFRRGRL